MWLELSEGSAEPLLFFPMGNVDRQWIDTPESGQHVYLVQVQSEMILCGIVDVLGCGFWSTSVIVEAHMEFFFPTGDWALVPGRLAIPAVGPLNVPTGCMQPAMIHNRRIRMEKLDSSKFLAEFTEIVECQARVDSEAIQSCPKDECPSVNGWGDKQFSF